MAGRGPVFAPVGVFHQFPEGGGIAFIQQIAGPLPSENRIIRTPPGGAIVIPFPFQKIKVKGTVIEVPAFTGPIGEDHPEEVSGPVLLQEVFLIRSPVIGISGGNHHPVHSQLLHIIEKLPDLGGVFSLEDGGVCGHAKAAGGGCPDGPDGHVEDSFPAYEAIMRLLETIEMDTEGQVRGGRKSVDVFLEKDSVGAKVDELLALDHPRHDFNDLGMDEGFSSGNGDDGSAAFFDRMEALLRSQPFLKDFFRILDLATSGTLKIASEKGFEHQDKRISVFFLPFFLHDICPDFQGLLERDRHGIGCLSFSGFKAWVICWLRTERRRMTLLPQHSMIILSGPFPVKENGDPARCPKATNLDIRIPNEEFWERRKSG
jgi:hypothetical protein